MGIKKMLRVAKPEPNANPRSSSLFFVKLPEELHDIVYQFAFLYGEYYIDQNVSQIPTSCLIGSLGDPTGFYFPHDKKLSAARVKRQMRQETLLQQLKAVDEFLANGNVALRVTRC
ncbi:MAG: hypothetical protein Q9209_001550 [Squamulea sp. 1 TL-2023]